MGNGLRFFTAFLAFVATLILIIAATDEINQVKFKEKSSKDKWGICGFYAATLLIFSAAAINAGIYFDVWKGYES